MGVVVWPVGVGGGGGRGVGFVVVLRVVVSGVVFRTKTGKGGVVGRRAVRSRVGVGFVIWGFELNGRGSGSWVMGWVGGRG